MKWIEILKINLVLLVMIVLTLISCKKEEPSNTTIVNGLIIDSLTQKPIDSVFVNLQQEDLFTYPAQIMKTRSDSKGTFKFNFEWGNGHSYSIKIAKLGYKNLNSVWIKKGEQTLKLTLIKE